MKRTEKIEIRLSHEEKTALTQLAEKEGRSVSRLVRDVVGKYTDLNSAQLPKKTSRGKLAGMITGAAFAGFTAASAIGVAGNSETYDFTGTVDGMKFSTVVEQKSSKPQTLSIKTNDNTFEIRAVMEPKAETPSVTISLCKKVASGCRLITEDTLSVSPRNQSKIISEQDQTQWEFFVTGSQYGT